MLIAGGGAGVGNHMLNTSIYASDTNGQLSTSGGTNTVYTSSFPNGGGKNGNGGPSGWGMLTGGGGGFLTNGLGTGTVAHPDIIGFSFLNGGFGGNCQNVDRYYSFGGFGGGAAAYASIGGAGGGFSGGAAGLLNQSSGAGGGGSFTSGTYINQPLYNSSDGYLTIVLNNN